MSIKKHSLMTAILAPFATSAHADCLQEERIALADPGVRQYLPRMAFASRCLASIVSFVLRTGIQRVCVASIFTLTCFPTAWALTDESPIDLPNGCTVFQQQLFGPVTIYKHDGRCKDGLAEGIWLFGRSSMSADGNRVRAVRLAGFSKGRANGFNLLLSDLGSRISVNETNINGTRFSSSDGLFKHNAPEVDFQRFLGQVDQANNIARSLNLPTADASLAKALIRDWRASPATFFDRYLVGEPTTPPWANGMSQSVRQPGVTGSSTAGHQTDDPKARGRSARVM